MSDPDVRDDSRASEDAPADPKRRTFLAVAGACGCAIVGAAAIPAVGLVAAPMAQAGQKAGVFAVGNLDDLTVGVPKKFDIVGDEVDAWNRAPKRKLGAVYVERTGDRTVRAFSVTCPHVGCAVNLVVENDKPVGYNCPCHDSNFGIDGSRGPGPSPRGLDPLPIEIGKDGQLLVTFKRFRLGVDEREEIG